MTRQSPTYNTTVSVAGDLVSLAFTLAGWAMTAFGVFGAVIMIPFCLVAYPWTTGAVILGIVVWALLMFGSPSTRQPRQPRQPVSKNYQYPEVTLAYQKEKRDMELWAKELQE